MRVVSCALFLALPSITFGQSADEIKATIQYVQSLQQPDGGFANAVMAKPASTLRATSAAIRALKYFKGELRDRDKVAAFVSGCFDEKTGGYGDLPGAAPDVSLTTIGILAAVELKLPADPYLNKAVKYLTAKATDFEEIRVAAAGLEAARQFPEEAIARWVKQVQAMANPDGSYGKPVGDARLTGSAVAMIVRTGGTITEEPLQKTVMVLQAGQRDDGGFGKADTVSSDLETTYRVARAFHLIRKKPKDLAKMKEFIARCRNADGGYGVAPGQPSSIPSTYFASIIIHWMK